MGGGGNPVAPAADLVELIFLNGSSHKRFRSSCIGRTSVVGQFEGLIVFPFYSFRELLHNGEDGFLISRINRETLGPTRPPGLHCRARSGQKCGQTLVRGSGTAGNGLICRNGEDNIPLIAVTIVLPVGVLDELVIGKDPGIDGQAGLHFGRGGLLDAEQVASTCHTAVLMESRWKAVPFFCNELSGRCEGGFHSGGIG